MSDLIRSLFDTSDFPARWHCGRWTPLHGWIHIVSDLLIFAAYVTIPLLILLIAWRKGFARVPRTFRQLAWYFIAFIVCCGLTHLNEAIIFYEPIYRWAAVLKMSTAAASWATVFALIPATPKLVSLRTPDELEEEVEKATQALLEEREATRIAKQLFQVAVEASPTGMLAVDDKDSITLVNEEAARIFGYDQDELLGKSLLLLIPNVHAPQETTFRVSMFEGEKAQRLGEHSPLNGRRKDGGKIPVEVGLRPAATPEGRIVLCTVVDKTESEAQRQKLREGQAELQRSNEELESFAGAASHDLKAPLRAVQHAVSWIEEDLDPKLLSSEMKEHLELLRNRTNRMEGLLDALLDYARVTQEDDSIEEFEVKEAVENVLVLLGPQALDQVRIEGTLPTVKARRVLFERVLSNLVSNALKHNPGNTLEVVITGRTEGDVHRISVADNGEGIDPTFHEKIFDVFQTLYSRDERESVGMGLAFVKKIVTREGGHITVSSERGAGATFTVMWPASPLPRTALPF